MLFYIKTRSGKTYKMDILPVFTLMIIIGFISGVNWLVITGIILTALRLVIVLTVKSVTKNRMKKNKAEK